MGRVDVEKGEEAMTNREPPNWRYVERKCCNHCVHYDSGEYFDCVKHEAKTVPWAICDDYEAEVPSEDHPE